MPPGGHAACAVFAARKVLPCSIAAACLWGSRGGAESVSLMGERHRAQEAQTHESEKHPTEQLSRCSAPRCRGCGWAVSEPTRVDRWGRQAHRRALQIRRATTGRAQRRSATTDARRPLSRASQQLAAAIDGDTLATASRCPLSLCPSPGLSPYRASAPLVRFLLGWLPGNPRTALCVPTPARGRGTSEPNNKNKSTPSRSFEVRWRVQLGGLHIPPR